MKKNIYNNIYYSLIFEFIINREVLDIDLTLSQERAQNIAGVVVTHINAYVGELRRLFLVEDLVDSLKFGLLLWLMTYIGAIFNGMTVVILGKCHYPFSLTNVDF